MQKTVNCNAKGHQLQAKRRHIGNALAINHLQTPNKTMYRIIFTLSFLLGSLAASAQQPKEWTLRQCIDYALETT